MIVRLFTCCVVLLLSTHAFAQTGAVALISYEVEASVVEANPWWAADVPQFSPFDNALRASQPNVFKWVWIEDLGKVSKVLRRPELSDANAVALASVIGGQYAIRGTLRVGAFPRIGAFDPQGVRAQLDATLIRRTNKGVELVRQMNFEAVSFAGTANIGVALDEIAEALNQVMDETLKPNPKAAGISGEEPAVVIRGAVNGSQLADIRQRLRTHASVDDVDIAWASPDAVALKINPAQADTVEAVTKIIQVLLVDFETFRLETSTPDFGQNPQFQIVPK